MFLTTASAILALSLGSSMARAAEGPSHSGEGGKAHSGGESGVHPAPNSGAHAETREGRRAPPSDIPHEGGVSIFGGTEHRPDGWRYRYEKGAWWYWSPKNHWTYYDNGAWQDYSDDNSTDSGPVASDPNFYWYHEQWWYLLPGNRWQFYDHGKWRDGAAGMGPQWREGDHRGESNKDEHGPHKDVPQTPKK